MKQFIYLLTTVVTLFLLVGCGHNSVVHSKGWGIDISWNQDSFIPNLRLGYWDASAAMVKQNAEAQIESNAGITADAGNGSNDQGKDGKSQLAANAGGNTTSKLVIKTGPQINGYTKDVLTNPNLSEKTTEAIKALQHTKEEKK